MARARKDNLTPDLLDWKPPKVAVAYQQDDIRPDRLADRVARAVSLALKGHKRADIATEMSNYLGEKITKSMLEQYASQARESHVISMTRFAALIDATGDYRLLSLLPELFGFAVVADKYQDIIELHLIDEHKLEVDAREATLMARRRASK